jgi:diaminohydroxyphosphoribosylaminopyrimidine deaminase / 5-amino-6-(5-phosphoribosylamino)uracil reductase
MDATYLLTLNQLAFALETNRKLPKRLRPWITLSYGMSLDGKIATYTGDSKYISSPETRKFVHELRHRHDAILVGIQTVIMDHPSLTTRLQIQQGKDAHRVILDSQLRFDLSEPMLHNPSNANTYIVTKANANPDKQKKLLELGVKCLLDPLPSAHIDLPWLMETLLKLGIESVLVEGGGTIHESFIRLGFFDRIYAQVSPLLIGGKDAKTPVEGQGFATLKEATRVAFHNHFLLGGDIIMIADNLMPK